MAKIPCFQRRGPGFDPVRELRSHMLHSAAKIVCVCVCVCVCVNHSLKDSVFSLGLF